jgi:hypothetical protein
VPRVTTFCICIYVFGCRLSLRRLCGNGFGIIPVAEITIGTTCTVSCFRVSCISFASSWYLFCFTANVLARLCVFGIAMSIRKVYFVFLFVKVMSGRLEGIVLSIILLRFQYSLKLSFSSTFAGLYL